MSVTTQECNGEPYEEIRKADAEEIFHSDDQSASDLFESFMEIANDPSLQGFNESGVNLGEDVGTKGAVTECAQSRDLVAKNESETELVDANDCVEQAVRSAAITQTSGSNGINEDNNSGKEIKSKDECDNNVGVRLSKAVDDLDGLEQQLFSMMGSFQGQPLETGAGKISEAADLENDEANDQEETVEIKAAKVVTSEEQQSNENHEKGVTQNTQESSLESESCKGNQVDEKTESSPCLLEEQVSGSNNQQKNWDEKDTVEMNEEIGEENTMTYTVEIENEFAGSCNDGAQTDEQSTESIVHDGKEITDETSPTVEPCIADGIDEDVFCEMTDPCDEKTQVDPPSTNSPENSTSNVQTLTEKGYPKIDLAPKLANSSVISTSTTVPAIEINTADESNSLEGKSLDSIDMEQSSSHSSSQPGSTSQSDEGIDSDARSDCGDDATLDPESLQRSRPRSWCLEAASRDSMHSDSSVDSDTKPSSGGKFSKISSLGEVLIRGHLLKMGGSGLKPKNWKKRWFVLKKDKCLYYYKQSKDKDSLGVIVLANYSISKAVEVNKKHCFRLSKGGARTYYLCTADEGDMRKWMMVLNEALRQAAEVDNNSFQISESNVHNVSIPALSIRDPDCHGYLLKLGQSKIKNWKRRYCVLKNGYLYYYTDMSKSTARGVAQLLGYVLEKVGQQGKRFCFNATPPEESLRTYFFAANSESERQRWMSRMEASIRKGEGVTADD